MSNFQLGLIIAGALVLIVVVAYNAWTTHRNAPKRPRPAEADPAQEPAARHEPAFDGAVLAGAGSPARGLSGAAPKARPSPALTATPWICVMRWTCPCPRPSAAAGWIR